MPSSAAPPRALLLPTGKGLPHAPLLPPMVGLVSWLPISRRCPGYFDRSTVDLPAPVCRPARPRQGYKSQSACYEGMVEGGLHGARVSGATLSIEVGKERAPQQVGVRLAGSHCFALHAGRPLAIGSTPAATPVFPPFGATSIALPTAMGRTISPPCTCKRRRFGVCRLRVAIRQTPVVVDVVLSSGSTTGADA